MQRRTSSLYNQDGESRGCVSHIPDKRSRTQRGFTVGIASTGISTQGRDRAATYLFATAHHNRACRSRSKKERVANSDNQQEPEEEPASPAREEIPEEQSDAPEGEADDLEEACDGAAAVAEETEDDGDALPAEAYPSLEEYKEKRARGFAQHNKPVPD